MNPIHDADRQLGGADWHQPWSGSNGGNCVEVKSLGGGRYAVRQSTDPQGPALVFTERELDVFAGGWGVHKAQVGGTAADSV